MDSFSTAPDFILDLIFLKLNQEDLHETLRVSKSWFWASIRRTKKLKITKWCNPLESIAVFYNNHRPPNEKIDCLDLFKHLVLDELVVDGDKEATSYLVNNGCNTAELTIKDSKLDEVPVTLASLKTITRLQSFEYCTKWGIKWHPFIVECMKSSECEFDRRNKCQIQAIKLNSSRWNAEDPVLKSVTKLSLSTVTIGFLRTMLDHCTNLKELRCTYGAITQEWRQVFPANVKRVELHLFNVGDDVARVVNVSTDGGRHLLPFLCQNWESVEKFHFNIWVPHQTVCQTVYEAFPQQREEVFVCQEFDEEMNLGSPHFQSREIHVGCHSWDALQLIIPSTKSVKLKFDFGSDSKFSPRDICLESGKVERFSYTLKRWNRLTLEPFVPNSFEGFTRLTSLTLSNVSALTIKMALDQCPSIEKLKLKNLKASTIGSMPRGSSYANVKELILEECEQTMHTVFQVFPRLSKFKQLDQGEDEICTAADWLWRHLIEVDKKYGVSYKNSNEYWYLVSDDLQASLSQAQKLLNEYMDWESVCHLKGFKLIPRHAKQKVIYID